MYECVAMAIGFILGAVCAICTVVALFSMQEEDEKDEAFGAPPPSSDGHNFFVEGAASVDEEMKSQWENLMNYNGTGKGQMSIGDE